MVKVFILGGICFFIFYILIVVVNLGIGIFFILGVDLIGVGYKSGCFWNWLI